MAVTHCAATPMPTCPKEKTQARQIVQTARKNKQMLRDTDGEKGGKTITDKRQFYTKIGFKSILSVWNHLGLRQEGFVGSRDEHKTPFSLSALSATVNLYGCCPEEWKTVALARWGDGETKLSVTVGTAVEKSLWLCWERNWGWCEEHWCGK